MSKRLGLFVVFFIVSDIVSFGQFHQDDQHKNFPLKIFTSYPFEEEDIPLKDRDCLSEEIGNLYFFAFRSKYWLVAEKDGDYIKFSTNRNIKFFPFSSAGDISFQITINGVPQELVNVHMIYKDKNDNRLPRVKKTILVPNGKVPDEFAHIPWLNELEIEKISDLTPGQMFLWKRTKYTYSGMRGMFPNVYGGDEVFGPDLTVYAPGVELSDLAIINGKINVYAWGVPQADTYQPTDLEKKYRYGLENISKYESCRKCREVQEEIYCKACRETEDAFKDLIISSNYNYYKTKFLVGLEDDARIRAKMENKLLLILVIQDRVGLRNYTRILSDKKLVDYIDQYFVPVFLNTRHLNSADMEQVISTPHYIVKLPDLSPEDFYWRNFYSGSSLVQADNFGYSSKEALSKLESLVNLIKEKQLFSWE